MFQWKHHFDGLILLFTLVITNYNGIVSAQFDNYYNWPEKTPPVVKTEVQVAGKETRIRCQIKDRFRHIQNGLNIVWEFKPCRAGHSAACESAGEWRKICGLPLKPCPPILILVEPKVLDSGLYRCHITLDSNQILLNVYLLQFIEKRREPPVIVSGMESNVTVVAPMMAVFTCKVRSSVMPTVRWFRRLLPTSSRHNQTQQGNFVHYLNNTYQLLNCCPVAALGQKDLYLSKLVISATTVFDSGFYTCLAINDANYTFREAHITVLPVTRATRDVRRDSFLGLFLIPAVFALIPTLAWMMWIRPRKPTSNTSTTQTQKQPTDNVPVANQPVVVFQHQETRG